MLAPAVLDCATRSKCSLTEASPPEVHLGTSIALFLRREQVDTTGVCRMLFCKLCSLCTLVYLHCSAVHYYEIYRITSDYRRNYGGQNDRCGSVPMHGFVSLCCRSVLIGVQYQGTSYQRSHARTHVLQMQQWLQSQGFTGPQKVLLEDDRADPTTLPTAVNVLHALQWLVRGVHAHDSLFLYFCGCVTQCTSNGGSLSEEAWYVARV